MYLLTWLGWFRSSNLIFRGRFFAIPSSNQIGSNTFPSSFIFRMLGIRGNTLTSELHKAPDEPDFDPFVLGFWLRELEVFIEYISIFRGTLLLRYQTGNSHFLFTHTVFRCSSVDPIPARVVLLEPHTGFSPYLYTRNCPVFTEVYIVWCKV